jgi:predicted PurR-regulated permease PerM
VASQSERDDSFIAGRATVRPVSVDGIPERLVRFRPRAVLTVVGVLVAVAVVLYVLWVARHILSWFLIALFLALAINPAVEWLNRHHIPRRGLAVAVIYLSVLAAVALLAAFFVPTLVSQLSDFVQAVPGYVRDLTHGRGPLGFLETRYQIVERVQRVIHGGGGRGGASVASGVGVVVSLGKTIATAVAGLVTVIFLTLFLLLEGPSWVERGLSVLPADSRSRWQRVGHDIYRTVGGYVTGNLLISVIAGLAYGAVLLILGVPYPVALGFIVALLDLIPLAGATLGGIIVCLAAVLTSVTAGIVMAVFVILYQQVENHVLQPVIYGRTVKLSPLLVLLAVLVGAEVAGVLGALGAIPIAGTLQVLLLDHLEHRRASGGAANGPAADASAVS